MPLPIRVRKNKYSINCHESCYAPEVLSEFGRQHQEMLEKKPKKNGFYNELFLNVSSLKEALETANYLLFLTR